MHTKILATIGPASNSREVLARLMTVGVRIFRLNFSHGGADQFVGLVRTLRELESEFKSPITILQDLSGPKIRIGTVADGAINVKAGDILLLGPEAPEGNTLPFIPFDNAPILNGLEAGDRLVLSDGGLQFLVAGAKGDMCFTIEAQNSGIITSRKGMALPGKTVALPALTDKDRGDLRDGLNLGVDAVALSFVQTPEDILEAKKIIQSVGRNIPVVAKLERQNAVDRLHDILEVADVIMVARGDLGVECPLPLLPAMQKRIIRACNRAGKPVIVATQMLLSMVNSPSPTRAETTDVANAVLDGADCVMLSEETAMGNFPVETVEFMKQIATRAEELLFERKHLQEPENDDIADFLAYSACLMAEKTNAAALFAHSMSGSSARLISSCRPRQPIYGLTPDPAVLRYLNFSWGVLPQGVDESIPGHLERVEHFVDTCEAFARDDEVIITAGQPKPGAKPRGTNLVKIYRK